MARFHAVSSLGPIAASTSSSAVQSWASVRCVPPCSGRLLGRILLKKLASEDARFWDVVFSPLPWGADDLVGLILLDVRCRVGGGRWLWPSATVGDDTRRSELRLRGDESGNKDEDLPRCPDGAISFPFFFLFSFLSYSVPPFLLSTNLGGLGQRRWMDGGYPVIGEDLALLSYKTQHETRTEFRGTPDQPNPTFPPPIFPSRDQTLRVVST